MTHCVYLLQRWAKLTVNAMVVPQIVSSHDNGGKIQAG